MSYRNKTIVIFDGGHDVWAYSCMTGWKHNHRVDFDSRAHDLRPLTDCASDEIVFADSCDWLGNPHCNADVNKRLGP